MFKFVPGQVRHAWWPVEWKAADEDGNTVVNRIEMRFLLQDDAAYGTLTSDTAASYDARWKDLKDVDAADREEAQRVARAAFAGEFVDTWRGIGDEAGMPVAWDVKSPFVQGFLQQPSVMDAVLLAHRDARRGARPNG